MRKGFNWEEVTEAGDSNVMGPGAYALKIVDVKDHDEGQYIEVVYDVAEGELKGRYAEETDDWKHSFRQYYNDKAINFFKRFLSELQRDNPNFTIEAWQRESDPKGLVGLNLGMLFRERRYINNAGEAKWALDADRPLSLDDVRNGSFTVPEPRYTNTDEAEWTLLKNGGVTGGAGTGAGSVYDASIPF